MAWLVFMPAMVPEDNLMRRKFEEAFLGYTFHVSGWGVMFLMIRFEMYLRTYVRSRAPDSKHIPTEETPLLVSGPSTKQKHFGKCVRALRDRDDVLVLWGVGPRHFDYLDCRYLAIMFVLMHWLVLKESRPCVQTYNRYKFLEGIREVVWKYSPSFFCA